MRNAINELGFVSHDNGGFEVSNTYVEKATGKEFSHKEFMDFLHKKFPNVKIPSGL